MQKPSPAVSDALFKLRPRYLEDCVVALLQSFAYPKNMYQRHQLSTGQGMRFREAENSDPLYNFFYKKQKQGTLHR